MPEANVNQKVKCVQVLLPATLRPSAASPSSLPHPVSALPFHVFTHDPGAGAPGENKTHKTRTFMELTFQKGGRYRTVKYTNIWGIR